MIQHRFTGSRARKTSHAGLIVLGLAIMTLGQGCTGRSGFDVLLPDFTSATFDFSPVDGTYDLLRRVGPGSTLTAAMVEFYTIDLTFSNPADRDFRFNLQVMAGGTQIGTVEVTLDLGSGAPSFVYRANAGARVTPVGMTDTTNGTFWLACTTPHDRTRGNAGRISDSSETNVRLRVGADHSIVSTTHQIKCEAQPVR